MIRLLRVRPVRCELCDRRYLSPNYLNVEQGRIGHCRTCYLKTANNLRRAHIASLRILLVEDDAHVRAVLSSALEGAAASAMKILEASDGNQAIDLARNLQPQVIVCDSSMKNGENLGERLRSLVPHSRIISFSGSTAERPWADHTIEKGTHQDLERLVTAVLKRHTYA